MKLGLVTAILEQYDYEKMIDTVSAMGFECVEVACWPAGKAERRYAGVSHIDVARVCTDDGYARHVLDYAAQHGVEISALAFYPNTMDGDLEKSARRTSPILRPSSAPARSSASTWSPPSSAATRPSRSRITLPLVAQVWPPIIALAEELGVK